MIEELTKQEQNRCYAYVMVSKPFDYLKMVNEVYCRDLFYQDELNNFALDHFNWLKENGVHHDTTYYTLINMHKLMVNEFARRNNREISDRCN